MRKIGNILILVGSILALVSVLGLVIGSVVLFVLSSPAMHTFIVEGIQNGTISTSFNGDPESVAKQIQALMLMIGIILLIVTLPTIAVASIGFAARTRETQGLYIAVLVFAVLSGTLINIIGSVLGLIDPKK